MPYFKDSNNQVHFLDDAKFAYLLPDGSVEITEQEANDLQNPPETPEQIIARLKAELDDIERAAIMPRGAREAFLALCLREADTAGLTEPQLYAANPFYQGLKDTDDACKVLRAQIRELT